jgi:hypothetical protein
MIKYFDICLLVKYQLKNNSLFVLFFFEGDITKSDGTKQEEEEEIDVLADFQERMTQS